MTTRIAAAVLATATASSWAGAQPATLARDIRTTPNAAAGVSPTDVAALGTTVYFAGRSDAHGVEPWTSDGTPGGTALLRDLWPGASVGGLPEMGSSRPRAFRAAGGLVYFTADDGDTGREVWRTDGTVAGTFLLKDIAPGPDSSAEVDPFFTQVGGTVLFFVRSDMPYARRLWRTDGTTAGTVLVATACGEDCPAIGDGSHSALLGGALYFPASDNADGGGLWRTDGTDAGTVRVTDAIDPGPLTAANGSLYFAGYGSATGTSLWTSDGTAAGTRMVKDLLPGPESSTLRNLTSASGRLFFAMVTATADELWTSDGTEAGTRLVREIGSGALGPSIGAMTAVGDAVWFAASDLVHGRELWRSDGTASGTVLFDLRPGPPGSAPEGLVVHQGQLFFVALHPTVGPRLWRSDGTVAGTRTVGTAFATTAPAWTASGPQGIAFAGFGPAGPELWRSDGTDAGTVLVRDLATVSSYPERLTALGARVVFAATLDPDRFSAWSSDGTEPGTGQLGSVCPGECSPGAPTHEFGRFFEALQNAAVFSGRTDADGPEPWRTDGTPGGTAMLADAVPGGSGSDPRRLTRAGGRVFYTAYRADTGAELWSTDGTAAGTALVRDIRPGSLSSSPRALTAVGDRVFFTADDGVIGIELWTSDGTAAGTAPVGDLHAAPGEALRIVESTASAGVLYYTDAEGVLRRSDGTPQGTHAVAGAPRASQLTDVGGVLYFVGSHPDSGDELWRTDGLPLGTRLVADLTPGPAGSRLSHLTRAGTLLHFTASDAAHGTEPWRSDGTAAGTVLLKDIAPGPGGSRPASLADVNGRLYFSAYEPATGVELWTSDGTPAGTTRVLDLAAGPASSTPADLALAEGRLFFSADDGVTGREPWSMPILPSIVASGVAVAEGDTGTRSADFRLRVAGFRDQPLVVSYATQDGSATGGSDYETTSGLLTFAPLGPDERTVSVPVSGDTDEEADEDFLLSLTVPATVVVVGTPARALILNDDSPVTLAVLGGEVFEGDAGPRTLAIPVRLSGPRGVPVTVDFTPQDGTATRPSDYYALAGTLTFPPGTIARAVDVTVNGDRVLEFDESLTVTLSNPTNASIREGSAAGRVLNDDPTESPLRGLGHGERQQGDLSTPAIVRIAPDHSASYEAVLDATGGAPSYRLQRLAGAQAAPPGFFIDEAVGRSPSLRWWSGALAQVETRFLRVATMDGAPGTPDQVYRLRLYETTLRGPRFQNSGSNRTSLVLHNASDEPVTGEAAFHDQDGLVRQLLPLSLPARGTSVTALWELPAIQGLAGSLTIAHDAPHGSLSGKTVTVDVETGLAFDHPLEVRPR
ncbi:MAG: ELWxxDGT repeat protein [Vicinamibacteria bacterium]